MMIYLKDEIRAKLKNGETIENVCTQYGISFKDLINLLDNGESTSTNKYGSNIRKTTYNHYGVRKRGVWYGTFATLEDANRIKLYLQKHGWSKANVDKACKEFNIKKCE